MERAPPSVLESSEAAIILVQYALGAGLRLGEGPGSDSRPAPAGPR